MKYTLSFFIIIIFFGNCGETTYQLKWKLAPGEKLIFLTRMEIINNLDNNNSKEQNNPIQYFSVFESNNETINLNVIGWRKKPLSQPKYPYDKFIPAETNLFSGEINAEGSISGKKDALIQKYLINILFELPREKVKIGDSWPLGIGIFDFSKKQGINKVKLIDIVVQGEEEIALLDYDIKSSGKKQSMLAGNIQYKGTAEFNLTKGKWEQFEGTLISSSPGTTEMDQIQQIKLTEISEPTYIELVESYKKANQQEIKNEKPIEEKPVIVNDESLDKKVSEVTRISSKKCPTTYCVQILATAEPIALTSKEFKGLPYKVEERYDPTETKFKYKYVVGNECSMSDARKLKKKIKKLGFAGAFIVKK